MIDKNELRERLRDEISALSDEYIAISDKGLLLNVVSTSEFIAARNIMLYSSIDREPYTHEIAKTALRMGKTVAFPYCYRGGIMHAHIVNSLDDLYPAMLGIPAPRPDSPMIGPGELDFIIVPALTFDGEGFRLGYGGGYYDRYLSGLPAYTVGLARERLIKAELPREPHDIAVKCVTTEERVFCPITPKK